MLCSDRVANSWPGFLLHCTGFAFLCFVISPGLKPGVSYLSWMIIEIGKFNVIKNLVEI